MVIFQGAIPIFYQGEACNLPASCQNICLALNFHAHYAWFFLPLAAAGLIILSRYFRAHFCEFYGINSQDIEYRLVWAAMMLCLIFSGYVFFYLKNHLI